MKKNYIFKMTLEEFGISNFSNIPKINDVLINSGEARENDVFIAIRGGNSYIQEAAEKGAYVIYDDKTKNISYPKTFLVNDSIKFLQKFAENWRNTLDLKIIGITGSNGKTTVKDIIYQLLSVKYKGKKTEGNLNNHIGLPVSLLRAENSDDFLVLEMGMSGFGEIDLLAAIAKPDYGIITNIGDSHLEFLGSRENVFKAKSEIIKHVKAKMFLNSDDPFLGNISGIKVSAEGKSTADYRAKNINLSGDGTKFDLNDRLTLETNLIGEHNILNLLFGTAISEEFGIKTENLADEFKNIRLTAMRFQKIENGNIIYINDAYNASPISMEKAVLTFSDIYNDRYKVVVLGDMLELGEKDAEFHEELEKILRNTKQNEILLYGPLMKNLYEKIKDMNVFHFEDKSVIREKLREYDSEKLAVLLKGSRGMRLEEIIEEGN
ncbi:MAG: UDP-N-acetylmuramoyl-tripeptide--D-alanyl-D-alanine ligase [Fusobacteriales bacterium]|jgi:UDP-N-acetylmuramoyl-tripeptide--D-alanyl-D-alanine ligase|nr:UDP-N-acetylmuramoyl-tripeptide--D-alanyl-D-alanine ligase [Fusobacteriales bacterium]